MKRLILLAAFVAANANAESLKGGYPACVSESLFDQMVTAINQNDQRAMQYLMDNGCIMPKSGIEVSVLDRTWSGKVKVRAYVGDSAAVLWTYMESLQ